MISPELWGLCESLRLSNHSVMDPSKSCFKVLDFKSSRAGFLSPCLPHFSLSYSFQVSASPTAALPSESLVSLTDFTLCFPNHVQISPAPLIKSSNPLRLQSHHPAATQDLSERHWKTRHRHLFSLRERKICTVCVCGCVNGPRGLGCKPAPPGC